MRAQLTRLDQAGPWLGDDGRPGYGSGRLASWPEGIRNYKLDKVTQAQPSLMHESSLLVPVPSRMGPSGPRVGKDTEAPCILNHPAAAESSSLLLGGSEGSPFSVVSFLVSSPHRFTPCLL